MCYIDLSVSTSKLIDFNLSLEELRLCLLPKWREFLHVCKRKERKISERSFHQTVLLHLRFWSRDLCPVSREDHLSKHFTFLPRYKAIEVMMDPLANRKDIETVNKVKMIKTFEL